MSDHPSQSRWTAATFALEHLSVSLAEFRNRHPYPFLLLDPGAGTRIVERAGETFGGDRDPWAAPSVAPREEGVLFAVVARTPDASGAVTLGRSRDADVVLPYAQVSKVHARIAPGPRPQTWRLADLHSSNGSSLNGVPLMEDESLDISDGDLLCLGGDLPFRFLVAGTLHLWLPALARRAG